MGLTDDKSDPGLKKIDKDTGMQESYLVMSDQERNKGFIRPLRLTYYHQTCGSKTTMSRPLAETYAVKPEFYGATYCASCKQHRPVGHEGEFFWVHNGTITDERVGT